jgi:hypothetical protein
MSRETMPSARSRKSTRKPSTIPSTARGNVVGIAASSALSVTRIVHDIMEDRSCRRLGTTVATSKFQRAMVTDRMLLDAARQLARKAVDHPLDYRYGLCVFGLMPARPAPGEAWAQFVRMCKAYSVSQHVLEAGSVARMDKVVASDAYKAAHTLYDRVRAPCPLHHMTAVLRSLVATTGRFSSRMPGAGRAEARQVVRHLRHDEHRIDFLRHVFYLTLSPLAPAGRLSSEAFDVAVRRTENACQEIFGRRGGPTRSDAAQQALDLAILGRVPQLYHHLSHVEDFDRSDAFKASALATVAKSYATPVELVRFSRRFDESVRVAERCNAQFMRARGRGGALVSTWSDTVFGAGSYVDEMLELPQPQLTAVLRVFPQALAAITDAHTPLGDAQCSMLKSILTRNPAWVQYLFEPEARRCVSA